MDFESCHERIWRAGLLHKASNKGINGRLWLLIKNFIIDRKYYIQVNDYKSHIFQSAVGIPQGSVISPVLCYMYKIDSISNIVNNHSEFADDSSVWNSDSTITQACVSINKDLVTEKVWCCRWNMSIAV